MRNDSRLIGAAVMVLSGLTATSLSAGEKVTYIDLEPYMNVKLVDNQGRGFDDNSLKDLPRGQQNLAGFEFRIGPGLIQLGSKILDARPERMDGIRVKKKFTRLNLLQATCFGGGPNKPGTEGHIPDGTQIGHYLVHYEDQSTEQIPIVYGEDVRDWFYDDGEKEPGRAKVVWKGDNGFATSVGSHLRLYVTTWTNPKPDVRVMRIDYVGRKGETTGAPMCLAMTAIKDKPAKKN